MIKNGVALTSQFIPLNLKALSQINGTTITGMAVTMVWTFLVGVMLNFEVTVGQILLKARDKAQQARKNLQNKLNHNLGVALTILS